MKKAMEKTITEKAVFFANLRARSAENEKLWAREDAEKATRYAREDAASARLREINGDLELSTPAERADRDLVMAAVIFRGINLRWAAAALRADREIVLAAICQHNGAYALQFAAPALRDDREIVEESILRGGWAIRDTSERLRRDRDLASAAVAECPRAIFYLPPAIAEELKAEELKQEIASAAAGVLGKLGGKSKSPAKIAAVQKNGRKGGRPRKS